LLHGLQQGKMHLGLFLPDLASEVNPRKLIGKCQFGAGISTVNRRLTLTSYIFGIGWNY